LASETTDWTVRRILDWTVSHLKQHGSESPRLDAEVLLAHACGWPRIQLYTHFEEILDEEVRGRMRELVKRRAAAEPVAYLVGYREFFSLRFEVGPGVFIPRPDTETLVVEALGVLKSRGDASPNPQVLDLCTGSGCIAISIAVNAPEATVTAVEQSPQALEYARRNAARHNVSARASILAGDLDGPLDDQQAFDVIVSNPPYVTTEEVRALQPDVRNFEPHAALDGGPAGLDIVERIAAIAARRLKPGGWVLLEISPEQAEATRAILEQAGLANSAIVKDVAGAARVVKAQKTAA
jgi:release factor glutamine methyltransferase